MQTKKFKDIELSRLGMGNMRLPVTKDDKIDYEKAQEIIDYAYDNGINYYDTAYVYHHHDSEAFLGQALKKYPRESYYIATKFFILSNPNYKEVFEEQLQKLQTDYIDFYLIHGIFDHTFQRYIDCGCIEYFKEQQRLGRIKYLGFSSHAAPENLEIFASLHDWDFAQIQINYFDWLYSTAKEEYEILTKRNIPVMVMEPVRGGKLAELNKPAEQLLKSSQGAWSISSWAFRWLMSLDNVQVVLSGMSTMDQIEDNVSTFTNGKALNKEEEKLLFDACELYNKYLIIPCTACRYCCDDCPMEINIPEYLKVFNDYEIDRFSGLNGIENIESKNGPKECIGCGACQGHCPQNIEIPEIMTKLAELI